MKRLALTLLVLMLAATPAAAFIEGTSTASNCGEGGNWIDITFTTDEGVSLVDAWWDFNGTSVWLDADGASNCSPQNDGVTSFNFYFDVTPGTDTQDFGATFTGFGGGDYFRFTMDLDTSAGGSGMPYGAGMMGGVLTVEFSDATVLTAVFDEPYDSTNGATAGFTNAAQPNFEFTARPGWAGPCVPRSANDAAVGSVPAPAFLIGEADSTWLNACYRNTGTTTANPSRMYFHLDGNFLTSRNLWTIAPDAWNGPLNYGTFDVRGGRHMLRVTADALQEITESDETDNIMSVQYCWQGDYLGPLATWTRAAPPVHDIDFEYGGGSWWNCDGVRVQPSASYDWVAVWGERDADAGSNYMLRLHPASDDPEDAFGANYGNSRGGTGLQARIVNTHTFGTGPWDVGILNFNDYTDDYRIAHLHESPYPFDFGVEPETPYVVSRLAMFQFDVDPGDLGLATLTLYSDPDDGPVHMGWLPPDFEEGNLEDLLDPVVTDAGGYAHIDLDLAVTGEYCCVVYGNRSEHPSSLAVNVGLYGPRPDLQPFTMNGWHAPIVPQPHASATLFNCPLPDTLYGGTPTTRMNLGAINSGLASVTQPLYGIGIDGDYSLGLSRPGDLLAGDTQVVQNLEYLGVPWSVRGGRHTLTLTMDYSDMVAESVERNNTTGRQYCWSPLPLAVDASATFIAPDVLPDRTGGLDLCEGSETLYPNCDGLRLTGVPPVGGNGWWRAVAVMPRAVGADIGLQLHEPLAGTEDGFGPNLLANSTAGISAIDFILVNDRFEDMQDFDVAVLASETYSSLGYHVQDARSVWRGLPTPLDGTYTMPAERMIDLHECQLGAGTWLITLKDEGPAWEAVDWGMSLYGSGRFHARQDAVTDGIVWLEPEGGTERMLVTVPANDYYCLAVWKAHVSYHTTPGTYRLFAAQGVSGVGDELPTPPAATRIVAASPNPFNPTTTISFTMEQDGPCQLALYDLQGRLVRTLIAEDRPAGPGEAVWDGLDAQGSRAASGVYLAQLQAAGTADFLKVTLVK